MNSKTEFDYQILRLSDAFYRAYPNPPFIEILKKKTRAYECRQSFRSRLHRSGLDYSKLVIIKNSQYIENENAIIDKDEYVETIMNLEKIRSEAENFLEDYCQHIRGEKVLHEREFMRRYQYSPLRYFHQELGLEVVQ